MKQSYLFLLCLVCTVNAFAYDFEVNGIYYNSFNNGNVEVTSNGTNTYSGDVVVPSSVMYNGQKYTVVSIGSSAFSDCVSLTSVRIPSTITNLDHHAFDGCSSLESINLPSSLKSIGGVCFGNCVKLVSIKMPNSVNKIGLGAFYNCRSLTSIQISNSVKNILDGTFQNCSSLTSVDIPKSVIRIFEEAFSGCSGLTSIIIPNSVSTLDKTAFSGCTGLVKYAYPDILYKPIENGIPIEYPTDDCLIDENGLIFDGSKHNLYYVPYDLKSVTIPESVENIHIDAFRLCSELTSISIPHTVKYIGDYSYCGCIKLKTINCDALTPPSLGTSVFDGVDTSTCKLIVPSQSLNFYKESEQWRDFINILSGVEMITIEESEIFIENGAIVNNSNCQIDVYTTSGSKVYSGNNTKYPLPCGIYIVRIGNKAVKLAL